MNYICKHCSGSLTPNGKKGEIYTFMCSGCGERWQGKTTYGYMHLYQTKRPSGAETKKNVMIRLYSWQRKRADERGGAQKVIDEALDE